MTNPESVNHAAPPPGGPHAPGSEPPQGLSITALILGVVALIAPCLGDFGGWLGLPAAIGAIVVGAIAVHKANRGEQGGKPLAITGIVLGVIALVLVVLLILVLLGIIAGFAWMAGGQQAAAVGHLYAIGFAPVANNFGTEQPRNTRRRQVRCANG
jgi:hypothetical protein